MRFTKLHGLGNDYIYLNGLEQDLSQYDLGKLARLLSDRHFGIGSNGIILILPSEQANFRMRIFNSDGSEAEMCGNGLRGFAKYVYEHGLTDKLKLEVETGAGILNMGQPRLQRQQIPMTGKPAEERVIEESLEVDGTTVQITCVSMGNPHCVIFVDDVDSFPVTELGPKIENHQLFPERTNVEFITVLDRQHLQMRVWERGAGETLACGTGAAAATVAGVLTDRSDHRVEVHLRGGELQVEWAEDNHVFLTGPATEVFSGEVASQLVAYRGILRRSSIPTGGKGSPVVDLRRFALGSCSAITTDSALPFPRDCYAQGADAGRGQADTGLWYRRPRYAYTRLCY